MMNFLLHCHPALSFTIVTLSSVALAVLGLILVRKSFKEQHLKENHEVASMIFNAYGLLYAVLMAFVVYAAWNCYDTTKKNVEMEVNKLADLYMDAAAFDSTMKERIRMAITKYTKAVVEEEWPMMERGGRTPQGTRETLQDIWDAYINVDVKAIKNPAMYEESLRQLNTMSEYRRLRRFAAKSYIPPIIWLVLIAGGVISVAFTFFFGTRYLTAQCAMTGVYTALNSMVLFLIYILDHPFAGYSAISSEPFKVVLRVFVNRLGQ